MAWKTWAIVTSRACGVKQDKDKKPFFFFMIITIYKVFFSPNTQPQKVV